MRSRGKFNVDVIDQPTVANIFYHRKSEVLYRQNVELKIDPLGLKKSTGIQGHDGSFYDVVPSTGTGT